MKQKAIMFVLVGALLIAMTASAAFATGTFFKRGTAGNDRLVGTAQNDVIRALGGNDKVYGKGDSDRLFGGGGRDILNGGDDGDRMVGGAGNDRINANEPGRLDGDRILCGAGRDVVINAVPTEDIIAASCEVVRR